MNNEPINWTKITHDTNGNPRYVCHFFSLLTDAELNDRSGSDFVSRRYSIAVKRANSLGGRKFHNKQYGGGIVFCTYGLSDLEKRIHELTGR